MFPISSSTSSVMFDLIYNLFLGMALLGVLPYMGWQQWRSGKYRGTWGMRSGWRLPHLPKKQARRIWVHAVSLGEVRAILPLLALWDGVELIISVTTGTGYREARRMIPEALAHLYLPFDFSWIMRRWVRHIQPDQLILSEGDLWYQLLHQAHSYGAHVALVNGKISLRSTKRWKKAPCFSKRLWQNIDLFCVQNETYRERFLSLGVDPNKLVVTGNLKLDVEIAPLSHQQKALWRERWGIGSQDRVVVIGSTHAPEEKDLLPVLHALFAEDPHVKVLLVPRHPERFSEVEDLLRHAGMDYSAYLPECRPARLMLVNAMGLLTTCYQLADIAVVAGSFTSQVGGHNILEPVMLGVPVLFGPHMHSQEELRTEVLLVGAGQEVTLESLATDILTLLKNFSLYESMTLSGQALTQQMRGAARRTHLALHGGCHVPATRSLKDPCDAIL